MLGENVDYFYRVSPQNASGNLNKPYAIKPTGVILESAMLIFELT